MVLGRFRKDDDVIQVNQRELLPRGSRYHIHCYLESYGGASHSKWHAEEPVEAIRECFCCSAAIALVDIYYPVPVTSVYR